MCAAPCHVAIVAASVLSAGLAALAGAAAPTLADANDSVRGIVKAKAEATISSARNVVVSTKVRPCKAWAHRAASAPTAAGSTSRACSGDRSIQRTRSSSAGPRRREPLHIDNACGHALADGLVVEDADDR